MFPIGRPCGPLDSTPWRRAASRAARIGRSLFVSLALAAAGSALAQQNLGFEAHDAEGRPLGWSFGADDADVAAEPTAVEGERSLRVRRAARGGVARVTQRVPRPALSPSGAAARTERLRLTGRVRTEAPDVSATLWLRIDGPRGPLFLDSAGYGRDAPAVPVGALKGPAPGDADWRFYEVELPLPRDVDVVAFGVAVRGEGTAWFDGLELAAVVTDAWPPAAPAAARYVEAALALMREHSLNRAEVDWPTLRTEALGHARGATTSAEAHLAVRFALRELGDRHSYLQSAAVTRALAAAPVSNARTGSPPAVPRGQRLGERIAYVDVPGFAGGTPMQQVEFAEALKNAIKANDGPEVCGWVVDLRQNTGGNLWPMLAGLGPLLGDGELAASVYPDGRRVAVWHRDGQAGFGDYTQLRVLSPYRLGAAMPVAVLLGPATASTGEVLAVAFRSRAATRSFGAATRGLSGGNRTFGLADGASLVLTVAATSDAAGRLHTGPLAPDEPIARRAPSALESSSDAALAAAVAWLTAGDSCH